MHGHAWWKTRSIYFCARRTTRNNEKKNGESGRGEYSDFFRVYNYTGSMSSTKLFFGNSTVTRFLRKLTLADHVARPPSTDWLWLHVNPSSQRVVVRLLISGQPASVPVKEKIVITRFKHASASRFGEKKAEQLAAQANRITKETAKHVNANFLPATHHVPTIHCWRHQTPSLAAFFLINVRKLANLHNPSGQLVVMATKCGWRVIHTSSAGHWLTVAHHSKKKLLCKLFVLTYSELLLCDYSVMAKNTPRAYSQ